MLTITTPVYQPSHISRKMPLSPLRSPINPFFRKEGDQDPWNDYIPDELTLNNENLDPTNVSSELSQKTKTSAFQKLAAKDREPFDEKRMNIIETSNQAFSQAFSCDSRAKKPISFEKAYKEMAHKLLDHQLNEASQPMQEDKQLIEGILLGSDQIRELEAQGEQAERSKMANFEKKLQTQAQKIQVKFTNLQQQVLENELKECTFTPIINKNGLCNRDFNGFLAGQKTFQQRSEAKKQALKENLDRKIAEEAYMRPDINSNSKKIVELKSQKAEPVFQRLYNARFASQNEIVEEISTCLLPEVIENEANTEKPQPNFVPMIHNRSKLMVRNEPIEQILYKDAQRRQEGFRKTQASKSKEPVSSYKPMNATSEKLIIQRFIKEFEAATVKVLKEPSNELNVLLDYLSIGEILKNMGFLSLKEPQESISGTIPQERSLLSDLWTILKGETYTGVSKRNLCMFLLSVQGLFWSENSRNVQNSNEGNGSIGSFNEKGEWELNEIESRWIHKTYDLFYRTRLASESLRKQRAEGEKSTFQPEISETSKVLAEHYRERLLEEFAQIINSQNAPELKIPENGALTHTDLLVLQKKTQKMQHEKKNKEKESLEIRNCPFKPQINNKSANVRKNNSMNEKNGPRHLELYNMGKNKITKEDRDPREIEFERNVEECTFKPEINQRKSGVSSTRNQEFVNKNIEKTVERMRNARKERDMVKLWTERGIPLKENSNSNYNTTRNCISSSRITSKIKDFFRSF